MIVEICASNLESALAAERSGADRIELCTRLDLGGLTPPVDLIERVISSISIPVHILIRPRAGDFVYDDTEWAAILKNIALCRELGCSGIVSGVLTASNTVDEHKTAILRKAANDMHFTFHRAFDFCEDPLKAVDRLAGLNIDTVLTSGQKGTALQGLKLLNHLQDVWDSRITIMPGAGINDHNAKIFKEAGFRAIHLSAIPRDGAKPSSLIGGFNGISDESMIRNVVSICH